MGESNAGVGGASGVFSPVDVAAARSLLLQNPASFAGQLRSAEVTFLSLVWISWLDRGDSLANYAGNTLAKELLLRATLGTALGIGIAWLVLGFPFYLMGLGLTLGVCVWWWLRRRQWRMQAVLHIMWGALLAAEFEQRFASAPEEAARELVEKVRSGVQKFVADYENWVGRPLVKPIG